MKHIGIYCSNKVDKKKLIQLIQNNFLFPLIYNIKDLKGEFFSSITIDKLIEEEYRHDKVILKSASNLTLREMSSGQQRMALANFIFNQKPNYVILDDINNNIDSKTLNSLHKLINQHSHNCIYIQLFSRIEDLLPYIQQVIKVDSTLQSNKTFSRKDFLLKETATTYRKKAYNISHLLSKTQYFDSLIKIKNVTVVYEKKPVLNKINWVIKAGEFWEIRGPIGSGKSTLISMIIGDNPKAFGQEIYLFGHKKGSGESVWDIKKHIGYFYPKMIEFFKRQTSVEDMILSGFHDTIGLYIKPKDWERKIAKEWMKNLELTFSNKNFQELSEGQQRIVFVIRAIIKQPPLIILDEPTAGLDDDNAKLFVSIIQAIARTKKTAILFISHRKEVGLQAQHLFELLPTQGGSISKITRDLN